MKEETLFNIPYYTLTTSNFKIKKKNLTKLFNSYPDIKQGIQTFHTNKQSNNENLIQSFSNIMDEELNILTEKLKANISITDVWSVTYKEGEYHPPHNHGSMGLTGILYLEFPKNSPITMYIQPWNNFYLDTTTYCSLPVEEGQIIVVPKFISHFTVPHIHKKIKKVISWDMNVNIKN
jgi:hypothetical protein